MSSYGPWAEELEHRGAVDRRLIWLLVRRLGGRVDIGDYDLAAAPAYPGLTCIRAAGQDGITLVADP